MLDGVNKVLITGASGYVASQILPTFKECYETVLIDAANTNNGGGEVQGVQLVDLIEDSRDEYRKCFDGVDAVVHLAYKRRKGHPIDHFVDEKKNVEMAYNVLRCSYEANVHRVVMASSNHATDWYEHALIHNRKLDNLDPYTLPLSDNFYGWAKASYEHLGFIFACGSLGELGSGGSESHVKGNIGTSRKMGVVMISIGAPRPLNAVDYKRDLGAYVSQRDLTQLFQKSIETVDITNNHGIPWQVVYGISNNTRSFWSIRNARHTLGYCPKDDSEIKFSKDINNILADDLGGRMDKA